MSKDGTRIGSLKQVVELRARIAELEAALAAEREARGIDTNRLLCEFAASRGRREAAEVLLSWLAMRGKWGNEERDAVAAHFARYEKEPT